MMDGFIYNSREFRRELMAAPHQAGEIALLNAKVQPGMMVLDAGANKGVTAVALARMIQDQGHLFAFEPVQEDYGKLVENLERNGVTNVGAYQLALSDRTGRICFYWRQGGEGSGITPADGGDVIWVEATTIDEFVTVEQVERIDFLNLDCEGSELAVLEGAKHTLGKYAPRIFCEIHHGYLQELNQTPEDVVGFLGNFGYKVKPLQVEDLETHPNLSACSHIYGEKPGLHAF